MLPIRKLSYFLLLLSISFLAGCEIEGYFRAEPNTIIRGESATLVWDLEQYSAQADSASIEPEIGSVRVNGTYIVRPDETTTYTITWTGKDKSGKEGTATEKTTVTVIQPPECSLEASSDTIIEGEPVTLSWASKNGDSYIIEPQVGTVVDPEGARVVYPAGDTTYTLKVSGPGGTAEASVLITTRPSIAITEPDGVRDYAHGSFVVKWADVDTDDNAKISLYYDTDNTGADGTLIADGIDEDQDSSHDTATWPTEQVPEGSYYIYAVIDDGKSEPVIDYTEFKVVVDHHTPRLNDISSKSVTELKTLSFNISAIDPNSDPLSFYATNLPEGASFNASSRAFFWTPSLGQSGIYDVQFSVADGLNTDTIDVQITVNKHPVSVTLNANPKLIKCGEPTVLSWSSIYADSYTIEPDVGTFDAEGSVSVAPSAPTTYTITATGESGTATDWVTVGINPPKVIVSSNPSEIQHGESATISWSTSCADSCVIEPEVGGNLLSGSAIVIPDHSTVYTVSATGPGGTTQKSIKVKVAGPPIVKLSLSQSEITYGDSVTLSWSVNNVSPNAFINQGIGSVECEGSREFKPDYTTTYAISASNENKSVFHTITVRVVGSPPPEALPEGSFGEQYQDLVPVDVSLKSYDEKRFVVLTGIIKKLDNLPLSGVRVEVFNHPEYGSALTDSEGRYSIPAEGGELLKLVYTKEGYITSHRQKETPWNDVVIFDPITLIKKDRSTTVVFDGNPGTIITHKSTGIVDPEFGNRSCTMVFTGDNMAYEMDKYGNVIRPLSSITTRATEFITPESMPSILPPLSAYTYCAELGVDGVERVKFDKPVIVYVDNFLDFPVGGIVPVGYYDRDKGVWVPSENGVVVELLDTNLDGVVDALDSDGDGDPDDLDQDGLFLDEIKGLENPKDYTPGTAYWRVSLNHFTPEDFNWPHGAPEDAISPNPDGEPSLGSGPPPCFAAGTLVKTTHGLIPIEQINEQHHVWSFDEKTGEIEANKVSRTYATPDRKLIELTFQNKDTCESIVVTPEHPFMVLEKGWTAAKDLISGDLIYSFNGNTVELKTRNDFINLQTVFNLEVENTHSYFVGISELLVHNRCTGDVDPKQRVLHQDIPVPGTGLTLHYASNRADGYNEKMIVNVPVSGISVPDSLKRIVVIVEVAGSRIVKKFDPFPNQKAEFIWDGKDYLGNNFHGEIDVHVSIGFVYDAVYRVPPSQALAFGNAPAVGSLGIRSRQEITKWYNKIIPIYSIRGKSDHYNYNRLANGWSLSAHHFSNGIVFKGNGVEIGDRMGYVPNRFAGTHCLGNNGDNGLATKASIEKPKGLTVDRFGNVYIASAYDSVRKVDTDNIITTVIGQGSTNSQRDTVDNPNIDGPYDIEIDHSGNMFIVEKYNHYVKKVDKNGIISIVAGTGENGFGGDSGLALYAKLSYPSGIGIDSVGNIYVADTGNNRIRKINTEGIISTIAGTGFAGYDGEGGLAVDARIDSPYDVAVNPAGEIYFTDSNNFCIRRIDNSGVVSAITSDEGFCTRNIYGLAIETSVCSPRGLHIDNYGNVFFTTYIEYGGSAAYMIDTNGYISTITDWYAYDVSMPVDIVTDMNGNIYVSGLDNNVVYRYSLPEFIVSHGKEDESIFTDNNGEAYVFSAVGTHEKTIDAETGKTIFEFIYENGRLRFISNRFGKNTEIKYDDGKPSEIISPYGLTTTLEIDNKNDLKKVFYPDDNFFEFAYTDNGLMLTEIDPAKNTFSYEYNQSGRLLELLDSESGQWSYKSDLFSSGLTKNSVTSKEGNQIIYEDRVFSGSKSSNITRSNGEIIKSTILQDGLTVNSTLSCGMKVIVENKDDPLFRYSYPAKITQTTESGLRKIIEQERFFNYEGCPAQLIKLSRSNSIKDVTWNSISHDIKNSTKTINLTGGKKIIYHYNPENLLIQHVSPTGLNDINFEYYDENTLHNGKLHFVRTGTREIKYTYYDNGFLHTITDPEQKITDYQEYDLLGRIKRVKRPDSTTVQFEYDANGNMTALITPANNRHAFGFSSVDLKKTYDTPHPRQYRYNYDKDRRLTSILFPSGNQIDYDYDDGYGNKSRLQTIVTPNKTINYKYWCGDNIESISSEDEVVAWTYDSTLVTSQSSYGTLNKTIAYRYDNNGDFKIDGLTYAGETEEILYDADHLLAQAGDYTITRNSENALPEIVSGDALTINRTFNGYAELDNVACIVGGVNAASWSITDRDNAGRIKEKTETISGVTDTYNYDYDDNGRLKTVTKNGALVEEYDYSNIPYGTCTLRTNTLRGITDQDLHYDEEDRLLSIGDTSYFYDKDGFLESKVKGDETTTYTYSSRGELLSVTLPDTRTITYLHDPLGRRIAKQVNGIITEKYLWEGITTLLAVFDGSDNLIMRFEYADDRMPVSMTKGSDTYFLLYDQVGTLRAVADSSGNNVKQVAYDTFGFILSDTNDAFSVPFGFAGGLHDRDTGLVRFGYRDYDPAACRWTAKDPILFEGGDTDLYGYVLSDSVNLIDSNGLWGGSWALAGAGALTGGVTGLATGLGKQTVSAMQGNGFDYTAVAKSGTEGAFIGTIAGGAFGIAVGDPSFGLVAASFLGAAGFQAVSGDWPEPEPRRYPVPPKPPKRYPVPSRWGECPQ